VSQHKEPQTSIGRPRPTGLLRLELLELSVEQSFGCASVLPSLISRSASVVFRFDQRLRARLGVKR